MARKAKQLSFAEEVTPSRPHFVQVISLPYTNEDGKTTSSIAALGDDGVIYKYRHGIEAWIPMTQRVLREV